MNTIVAEYLQKHILGHPFRETIVLGSINITSHQDVTQTAGIHINNVTKLAEK